MAGHVAALRPHLETAPEQAEDAASEFLEFLPDSVRSFVLHVFETQMYEFGESIISEGDEPDSLFFLVEGMARVVKQSPDGDEVALGSLGPGDVFGETGILRGGPRTATIRASSKVVVRKLSREVAGALLKEYPQFAEALHEQGHTNSINRFLRTQSMFSTLPYRTTARLARSVKTVELQGGDVVFSEGDLADCLYVVQHGRLRVYTDDEGTQRTLRYLRSGDMFGEAVLNAQTVRSASIVALEPTSLLQLQAETVREMAAEHPELEHRIAEIVSSRRRLQGVPLDFSDELDEARAPEQSGAGTKSPEIADPELAGSSDLDGVVQQPPSRRRRHFAFVRQLDEMDCGAACLGMVARAHGCKVSLTYVRQESGVSLNGTTLSGIRRGGEAIGLTTRSFRVSPERLREIPLPAILHWEGNHWVVLYEVGSSSVRIADPAIGLRRVPRGELDEKWTGYAALLTPTPALHDAPKASSGLRWVLPFLRPHLRILGFALAMAIVAAAAEVAIPVLTTSIIDNGVLHDHRSTVIILGAATIALALISAGVLYGQRRALTRAAVGIDVASLEKVTETLLGVPMSYFETRRSGDLERRLTSMQQVNDVVTRQGVAAITAVAQLGLILAVMFFYSPSLAGIFLGVLVTYMVLIRFAFVRVRPLYAALEHAFGLFTAKQIDLLKGIEAVKVTGRRPGIPKSVSDALRSLAQKRTDAGAASAMLSSAIVGVGLATTGLFIFLGSLMVIDHQFTLGQLLAFNVLVALALSPAQLLASLWDDVQRSSVLLNRLQDIFEQPLEQADRTGRLSPVPTLEGRVSLRRVGVAYGVKRASSATDDRSYVLRDIDFEIPAGTTVGVVGRSGSGKSTLLKLLAGLIEPTIGSVRFDATDIAELDYGELRKRIGFVQQAPYLFNATIAENIALGDPNPDIEQVRRSAELAHAHAFIERLPLGYETKVGDGGLRLSGGETQRVAIARALYWDPAILLMDEATSALDSESERLVRDNLSRSLLGKTSFIAAHRLSTIRDADLIMVLESGRLVEIGRHEQLIARNALYAYLYSQQAVS
jgi:ABC-type bacteriocin/lantibiotic exporter with double-glycine peptidase domain/CRP-like cAMP-binding protein